MAAQTESFSRKRMSGRTRNFITLVFAIFALVFAWYLVDQIIKGNCDGSCVVRSLSQALRTATPIAFAALTGVLCERAGVTDIGIEGKMLMSAMTCYAVNLFAFQALKGSIGVEAAGNTSRILALFAGMISAALLAALHAVVSIKYKANQIISGTVINILALGITGYFYRQFLAENIPAGPGTFPLISSLLPVSVRSVPVLNSFVTIFLDQKPLTYVMLVAAMLIHYVLWFTPWGLRTRAVGEHPRAADTLGVNVFKVRYTNVILGGVLAGLGGAWFTLESVDVFNPGMTAGLGFIGLAAMIFGKWTPFGSLIGALIFGLGSSVTTIIGIYRPDIPSQIPDMLPYLLTIVVLTGVVGRAVPPAADGEPYDKQ